MDYQNTYPISIYASTSSAFPQNTVTLKPCKFISKPFWDRLTEPQKIDMLYQQAAILFRSKNKCSTKQKRK